MGSHMQFIVGRTHRTVDGLESMVDRIAFIEDPRLTFPSKFSNNTFDPPAQDIFSKVNLSRVRRPEACICARIFLMSAV
jgi:hypothetical protein